MVHPNDANGDALRRLEADGDDLSQSRDIDFTVVFKEASNAQTFAKHFSEEGYSVEVRFSKVKESYPLDVVVTKHMIPLYQDIIDFEDDLDEFANPLQGMNDGWGCFTQLPKHLQ